MQLATQHTSKSRVKNDQFGDTGFERMFKNYNDMTVDGFRQFCIAEVEASHGKKETKFTFVEAFNKMKSKDTMLQKLTNYMLAGQGFKV